MPEGADRIGVRDDRHLIIGDTARHEVPPPIDELNDPRLVPVGDRVESPGGGVAPGRNEGRYHIDGIAWFGDDSGDVPTGHES